MQRSLTPARCSTYHCPPVHVFVCFQCTQKRGKSYQFFFLAIMTTTQLPLSESARLLAASCQIVEASAGSAGKGRQVAGVDVSLAYVDSADSLLQKSHERVPAPITRRTVFITASQLDAVTESMQRIMAQLPQQSSPNEEGK